jgi:hypothetical protein
MKITLKKVVVTTPFGTTKNDVGSAGITTEAKWQFKEQPTIYLCKEVERVLGLHDVPVGTTLELNIDKFCVIPPGGCS